MRFVRSITHEILIPPILLPTNYRVNFHFYLLVKYLSSTVTLAVNVNLFFVTHEIFQNKENLKLIGQIDCVLLSPLID